MSPARTLLAAGLASLCFAAAAEDRDLVAPLPPGVGTSQVMDLVRATLTARDWRVLSSDAISVTAESRNSRIRLYVLGTALRYSDQADSVHGSKQRSDDSAPLVPVPPARVADLRGDLVATLGTDLPSAPAAARSTAPTGLGLVLIGDLPPNLSDQQVMRAVTSALAGRRFRVTPEGDAAVTGRLRKGLNNTTLRIFKEGNTLRYLDTTTTRVTGDVSDVPERWVDNLRADIRKHLEQVRYTEGARTVPPKRTANEPTAAPGNAAERLRALKRLFDAGMITQTEYDSKRTEILKDL